MPGGLYDPRIKGITSVKFTVHSGASATVTQTLPPTATGTLSSQAIVYAFSVVANQPGAASLFGIGPAELLSGGTRVRWAALINDAVPTGTPYCEWGYFAQTFSGGTWATGVDANLVAAGGTLTVDVGSGSLFAPSDMSVIEIFVFVDGTQFSSIYALHITPSGSTSGATIGSNSISASGGSAMVAWDVVGTSGSAYSVYALMLGTLGTAGAVPALTPDDLTAWYEVTRAIQPSWASVPETQLVVTAATQRWTPAAPAPFPKLLASVTPAATWDAAAMLQYWSPDPGPVPTPPPAVPARLATIVG